MQRRSLGNLRARLRVPLRGERVALRPLLAEHRNALNAACAEDQTVWHIYPRSYAPKHFDESFDALIGDRSRIPFAVFEQDRLVGMTAYLRVDEGAQTLEIGNSYLAPAWRGTGVNIAMKRLMIDHAFVCGMRRIEFRVDARNLRSQSAVRKIGGVQEGFLRAERVTWTGHVRDTCLFALLASDWDQVRDRLV